MHSKYFLMLILFIGLFWNIDNNILHHFENSNSENKKTLSQKNEVIKVPIEHGIYHTDGSCDYKVNNNYNENLKNEYPAFYQFDIKNYFSHPLRHFLFVTKDTTMHIYHRNFAPECDYSYEKLKIDEFSSTTSSTGVYSYKEDTIKMSDLDFNEYLVTYNDEKIIKYRIDGKNEYTNGTLKVDEYENGVVTSYEGMEIVLLENSYIFKNNFD